MGKLYVDLRSPREILEDKIQEMQKQKLKLLEGIYNSQKRVGSNFDEILETALKINPLRIELGLKPKSFKQEIKELQKRHQILS